MLTLRTFKGMGHLFLKVISSILDIPSESVSNNILLDAYVLSLRNSQSALQLELSSSEETTMSLPCVEALFPVLSLAAHHRNYR